ncbi:MAG: transporter substrate-binding domain-containing protein [Propionibacteriaceae bacterium]|jgi:ABC-type amino acid transport substrate-binding protein|nr:transporter substrate-binding domain-containing protein [Propionibacteriaceae bacterium]
MKKIVLAAAASMTAIVLTACGSPAPSPDPAGSADAGVDPAVAALGGKIVFGTEGTYAPFTYHDTASNELVGYDIEVARAVAEKLGVTAEFQETAWDGIFAALEAGRFNAVSNEVEITDARKEKYDMTEPYSVSYPVVLTRTDNTTINTVADLKGKTTGQAAGSNWGAKAESYGASVEPVPGFSEAAAAVKQGRIDFTLNDALTIADYFTTTKDTELKIAVEITDDKVYQGFAFNKDSGLLPAVNAAITELRTDGTLAAIGQKYFGKDISS